MSMPPTYLGPHPCGKAVTGFFAAALASKLVVAMVAVTVIALGVTGLVAIDGDYLRQGATAQFWPRDAIDDFAFASLEAKRVSATTAARPTLMLVGTAAMREGLLPASDIQKLVSKRVGHDVPVLNLMTGGQSPLEAAALVWEVAPKTRGTLVLAVSPSRMAASGGELQGVLDHPRLAFSNEGLRKEATALGLTPPKQTGIYLWDNLEFYVIRLPSFVRHWLGGKAEKNDVQTYLNRGREDGETWGKDMGILSKRLATYDQNFPVNIAPYRRLIRWVRENHYPLNVVLLEIPLNPKAIAQAAGDDFYRSHVANLKRFCHDEGCNYVNLNTRNLLAEDQFYDWSHLSSHQGKEIYTDAFLTEIQGSL